MSKSALVSLVGLSLLLLLVTSPLNPLWRTPIVVPIQASISHVARPAIAFVSWFADVPKLAHQRDQLAAERNQLLARLSEQDAIKRQNDFLRQELSVDKQRASHLILAPTAGPQRDGSTTYLLLAKGAGSGIKKGQVVIENGVLVGKVTQTTKTTSLVQIPQSLGSAIPAIIHYPDGSSAKGIVEGSFNLSAQLNQVLPTEKLLPGATITTSADGNLYPPDLVIGKVGQTDNQPNQPFQSATIEFLWDVSSIDYVMVLD